MTSPGDQPPSTDGTSFSWGDLQRLKEIEQAQPGTITKAIEALQRLEQLQRRMTYAHFALEIFGYLCALVSVTILCVTARYFIDHGAPTQGAGIFGAGTALVGAFLAVNKNRQR